MHESLIHTHLNDMHTSILYIYIYTSIPNTKEVILAFFSFVQPSQDWLGLAPWFPLTVTVKLLRLRVAKRTERNIGFQIKKRWEGLNNFWNRSEFLMQNVQIRVGPLLVGFFFLNLGWILAVRPALSSAEPSPCKSFSFSFVFLFLYKNKDLIKLVKNHKKIKKIPN
jgi:hypothetical protein